MNQESAASPPTAKKAVFRFERDDGHRAEAINEMFNRFTGRRRSAAAYKWEWFDGYPGPGFVWAIIDPDDDRVVGHHGIIQTPLVVRGVTIPAGRTENTIIEADVRKKIFYPGMEKKAFNEVTRTLAVLYTVHASGAQGRIRERLGYVPVGRWLVFLPIVRPAYLRPLVGRVRQRIAAWIPGWLDTIAAHSAAAAFGVASLWRRPPRAWQAHSVTDLDSLREEYSALWSQARADYDVTIDRSWDFLRWRVFENPNLEFRIWGLREGSKLMALVVAHEHRLGDAVALYIDDIICRHYRQSDFEIAVGWLPFLSSQADAVVAMTLDADTPLRRALEARHRVQSIALRTLAPRLFDEMVVFDRDGACAGLRWYVTPLFTEGLDTSR